MIAHRILQDYLDAVGRAVMEDDFATYADHVSIPFVLATAATTLVIKSVEELEHGFDSFVELIQSQGVTDYVRAVESAVMTDDGLISGRYVTHLLSDGTPRHPSFASRIGLRHEDDRWRAVTIANDLANAR